MNSTAEMTFDTDDRRWRAIEVRDERADGAFLIAVKTTGIYCRPTCRSRRPNRANVVFFDDVESAERAGFRACKRCKPGGGVDPIPAAITRTCATIQASEPAPSLSELAAQAGLSPSHFHRTFVRIVGVTPKEYAMTLRARKLRDGLVEGGAVSGAILGAGFGSIGRAYDRAADDLGMTPAEYRAGGQGRAIRFATAETPIGWVAVASTEVGLCWLEFGDDPKLMESRLRERFPGAEPAGDDTGFADRLRQVVERVGDPRAGRDLPLDVRGTAFQRRVWDALRAIPVGSTATYAEVARSIGRPTAARAVARACATNDVSLVIPCHRVVRGDGGLGGYRWGIGRKRALLDVEADPAGGAVSPGPGAD